MSQDVFKGKYGIRVLFMVVLCRLSVMSTYMKHDDVALRRFRPSLIYFEILQIIHKIMNGN